MADNPFDDGVDYEKLTVAKAQPVAKPRADNPFDNGVDYENLPATGSSSAGGAFVRAAERGVAPMVGGLAAAGAGARIGGLAGAAAGSAFPVVGTTIGGVGGALVGALGGFFAGAYGAEQVQSYALSKAPDSWKETFGQDDQQQKLDQEQHPYATFLGGLAPFALTMSPAGIPAGMRGLPENATTLMKILANPATARVFGGTAMGGFELGHELWSGESPDWAKVAIATGFGVIFNRPNVIGERIEGFGARLTGAPARTRGEAPAPNVATFEDDIAAVAAENARVAREEGPTTIQGSAFDVMGEGVTEPVFHGSQQRDPAAKKTALLNEIAEQDFIAPPVATPEGRVDFFARMSEPEVFDRYDALRDRMQTYRESIAAASPTENLEPLLARQTELQGAYDALLAEGSGYRGGREARQLRAQLRDVTREIEAQRLREVNSPWVATVRAQLMAADAELRDISREVAASRRRAAEALGSDMIEPPVTEAKPAIASVAPESSASSPPLPVAPIEVQRTTISNDVQGRLVAAGRPLEEAQASAAIIAARFETRAARFEGRLGTAEELFRREGAEIRGPQGERMAPGRPEATIELNQSGRDNLIDPKIASENISAALEHGSLDALRFSRAPTATEMNAVIQAAERHEAAETVRLFGDKADEATRRMRSKTANASDKLDEFIFDNYGYDSPQNRFVYGSDGASIVNIESLRNLRTAITEIETAVDKAARGSPADLVKEISWLSSKLPDAEKPSASHTEIERVSTLSLAHALSEIKRQNVDLAATLKDVVDYTGSRVHGSGSDVATLLDRLSQVVRQVEGAEATILLPQIYEQTRRGAVKFYDDSTRPIITLAKDADASTFMHESGHTFLEEMLRDARHAAAPESIRADTQALRKYLKMAEDAEAPTRAQHERFARSFEQYLREGVAPSRQLAGVFNQFRDWLMKIYQSLRGLGKPISDDIREVFDRMLAENPERVVISRETPEPTTLGGVHARDAVEALPEEAGPIADRVARERVEAVNRLPEQVRHELEAKSQTVETAAVNAPDRAGETGAGAAGSESLGRAAAGSDAIAPGGGGRAESEGVGVSGGSAAPEGAGLSSGRAGERSPGIDKPLAERPFDDLSNQPSRAVDLAGNIRLENVTNIEELRGAIRQSAERNNDFRDVRGPMTRSQIMDAANDLDLKPSEINVAGLAEMFGGAENLAPKIMALRMAVRDSAAEVVATSARVAAAPGDMAAVVKLAQTIDRHDMAQSALSGVTAEWGRAGSAFRSIVGEWDKAINVREFLQQNTGRTPEQIVKMAKLMQNLDTTAKVSKAVREAQTRSGGRMMVEYFINALISGPASWTSQVIGNTALLVNKIGPESLVAAAIGKARSIANPQRERILAGEVGAQAAELVRALPKAVEAAAESMRSGVTANLPGGKPTALPLYDTPGTAAAYAGAREISTRDMGVGEMASSIFGMLRGGRDAIVANAALLRSGVEGPGLRYSPIGQIPDVTFRGANVLPVGTALRVPSRVNAAMDSLGRTLAYSTEINGLAYRMASNEGKTGLEFNKRVAYLRQNPSKEMMEGAAKSATDISLMSYDKPFVQKIVRFANHVFDIPGLGETPVIRTILPFINIAANVIDQALVKRTPLGFLSKQLRADLAGESGAVAQDMAQSRMLLGSMLSMTFAGLAAEGYVNGSGPKNRNEAAVWREAGNKTYSLRIGDTWYDLHRLGPLGMLLGVSADFHKIAQTAGEGEMLDAAGLLVTSFAHNILDESFMRGPAELLQAIEDPDRYGGRYVQNFLSSFTPYSVGLGQIARANDPYSRQARTVLEAIQAKMPVDIGFGKSTDLFPRRSIWGEPVPTPDALIAKGVTAIYLSKVSNDPVNIAMTKLGMGVAPVKRSVMNVELTDQQYDDYARLAGITSKQRLDVIVRAPNFQSWPPAIRRQVIEETITRSRRAAQGLLMMKYPQIPREAAQAKLDDLRATE